MRSSINYIVKRGDTINSIVNRFGLKSWDDVYYANANKRHKAGRKYGEVIMGELWVIPQSEQKILLEIYEKTLNLQKEYMDMSLKIEEGLKRDYSNFNADILTIDITATILTTIVSMGATGIKAVALEGQALKAANMELLKSTKKLAVDIPRTIVESHLKINNENYNLDEINDERSMEVVKFLRKKLPEVGKKIGDILEGRSTMKILKGIGYGAVDILGGIFNIITPSWLAEKITGIRPGEVHAAAIKSIVDERNKTMNSLGLKAAAIYEELNRYSRTA